MSETEFRWERVSRAPQQKGPFAARQSTQDFAVSTDAEAEESPASANADPHPLAMWLWLFALLFLLGLAGLLAYQLFQ